MSISLRATGTWAELTADGTVAIPATPQAGDRMFLFARWKDFSVTVTVANWTELTEFADGAVSSGNGTGSVKVGCWYRDWQPGDSDPTIDFSASPTNASVVIQVWQKSADDVWQTPVARTAAMTTWTTTSQSVSASATVAVPSSSVVMGLIGIRDDTATMTRPTSGIDDASAAITWDGDYVESPATHHSTTTGEDGAADLGYRLVSVGATATLRMTGTISAAETGAALWVVQGVNTLVTPSAATLVVSLFAAFLSLSVVPATTTVTTTAFAPSLNLTTTPATASLSTTQFAPALRVQITPATATITITSFVPVLHESLTPTTATLGSTTFAPVLREDVTPAAVSLSLTTFAPTTLTITTITIPNSNLVITTSRPHILPFRVIFLDPGGDATHAVGHFNQDINETGLITYDNTHQVEGAGSYKFDSDTGVEVPAAVNGVLGAARRVSAYFGYDSQPDALLTETQFVSSVAPYSSGSFDNEGALGGDDGVYATAAPARNGSQGGVFGNFDWLAEFETEDVTIDSIKIIYERKYDTAASIGISRVKYRINGVEGPNHDNTDQPLTDTVVTVDVTADRAWVIDDLLDGAFDVVAEACRGDTDIPHTQSWDYIKVEVEWTSEGIPAMDTLFVSSGFNSQSSINVDDGVYATATSPRNAGRGAIFSSLGLDIPNDAIIDSVKIIYERKYDTNTSIGISRVKWRVNGEEGPDHDNTDEPLTDTIVEVDVTGDRAWERQDLLNGVFEVIAEARRGDTDTEHTQSWDYVKVEVVYHLPATIMAALTSSNLTAFRVAIRPKDDHAVLRFVDGAGNSYDGITPLLVDTDNRISFAYVQHASDDLDIKLYVNGIEELSIEEASTAGLSALANFQYGWLLNPGANHLCWFSHIKFDDGDDLSDAGNVLVTAKLPAAVNEDNWDTDGGTGAVNERPLSETNYKFQSGFSSVTQTYTLQAAAVGDVDISGESIVGYMGWAWSKREPNDVERIGLIVNNVDVSRGSAITTSPSLLKHAVTSTSYPSHANGIGMSSNSELAGVFMYECGAVLCYQGPLNPDILLERQLVNNETLDTIIDDLRAAPPDSYEICCIVEEFEGSVEIAVSSLDQEGGSFQSQGLLNSSGGTARLRITAGIEVRLDITVVGVTMLTVYKRVDFE